MEQRDGVLARRRCRALTPSGSQSGSLSSSAKQKVYLPGLPSVARSISPGMPPPTLRMMSCSARPMVALARLPWPSALTPRVHADRLAIGPLTITIGPENCVVHSRPCMREQRIERGLEHAQHDRHVLGLAAGHHRVDRHLLDRARARGWAGSCRRPRRACARCRPACAGCARRSAARPAGRRSSRARSRLRSDRPIADGDAARVQAGLAVARDQRLRHAGLDASWSRSRAATPAGRRPVAGIAGDAQPFVAVPARRRARPRGRLRSGSGSARPRS